MVSTIDGETAIEDISAGDLVLAGDPVTGDVAYCKVLEIYRNSADTLAHVRLENGEEIVTTNASLLCGRGRLDPCRQP